jgi:hypothetical protein
MQCLLTGLAVDEYSNSINRELLHLALTAVRVLTDRDLSGNCRKSGWRHLVHHFQLYQIIEHNVCLLASLVCLKSHGGGN